MNEGHGRALRHQDGVNEGMAVRPTISMGVNEGHGRALRRQHGMNEGHGRVLRRQHGMNEAWLARSAVSMA